MTKGKNTTVDRVNCINLKFWILFWKCETFVTECFLINNGLNGHFQSFLAIISLKIDMRARVCVCVCVCVCVWWVEVLMDTKERKMFAGKISLFVEESDNFIIQDLLSLLSKWDPISLMY